jgi:calcium binding protein 39
MPLFSRGVSSKPPQELVKGLRDALMVLEQHEIGAKKAEKAVEESTKLLQHMKIILYGSGDQEPQTELAAQLAQEFYNFDMPLHIVNNLAKLEFEAKKDVAQIFNNLLRRQIGVRSPTVEYICTKNEILYKFVRG